MTLTWRLFVIRKTDQIFIDFNKIIPQPPFIFNKACGSREEELAEKLKVLTWTKFNSKNWGTKWNAYAQTKEDNQIRFNTAWSCPIPVIMAIAIKFPMLEINIKYADEDSGYNVGNLTFHNGELEAIQPDGGSKEAYGIYFEINPEHVEDYQLIDGNYEYIDG